MAQTVNIMARPSLKGLRTMFLLVTPNETSFETLEKVPKFVDEVKSDWKNRQQHMTSNK